TDRIGWGVGVHQRGLLTRRGLCRTSGSCRCRLRGGRGGGARGFGRRWKGRGSDVVAWAAPGMMFSSVFHAHHGHREDSGGFSTQDRGFGVFPVLVSCPRGRFLPASAGGPTRVRPPVVQGWL